MQNDFQGDLSEESPGKTPGTIDIEPYRRIGNDKSLMDILLFDNNSRSNLIWATDGYESQGYGFGARDSIQYLFIINPNSVIRPRYLKSSSEQRNRSRDMAEVFTPPWIVNRQNNLVDEQWTGRRNPFNTEEGEHWTATERADLGDRDWKEYVRSVRMEVCCGEAPYLTTRYDAIDGTMIPVDQRVGILDRKLRVVSENVDTELSWLDWAKASVRSIYGYDFQGDNVLLARENVLLSFMETFRDKFGKDVPDAVTKDVCRILSWNIWQMDGMKMVVPYSCDKMCSFDDEMTFVNNCPACRTGKGKHCGLGCRIMDWDKETTVEFASLMRTERSSRPRLESGMTTLDNF